MRKKEVHSLLEGAIEGKLERYVGAAAQTILPVQRREIVGGPVGNRTRDSRVTLTAKGHKSPALYLAELRARSELLVEFPVLLRLTLVYMAPI